jgi:DNA-binding FrmR family transcriptional regulator
MKKTPSTKKVNGCKTCAKETGIKHEKEIKLVNRINGQVTAIGIMIEERRYCPDIINQVRAARAALKTLETRILETHLQTCFSDAFRQTDKAEQAKKLEEVLDIFRRY